MELKIDRITYLERRGEAICIVDFSAIVGEGPYTQQTVRKDQLSALPKALAQAIESAILDPSLKQAQFGEAPARNFPIGDTVDLRRIRIKKKMHEDNVGRSWLNFSLHLNEEMRDAWPGAEDIHRTFTWTA